MVSRGVSVIVSDRLADVKHISELGRGDKHSLLITLLKLRPYKRPM